MLRSICTLELEHLYNLLIYLHFVSFLMVIQRHGVDFRFATYDRRRRVTTGGEDKREEHIGHQTQWANMMPKPKQHKKRRTRSPHDFTPNIKSPNYFSHLVTWHDMYYSFVLIGCFFGPMWTA